MQLPNGWKHNPSTKAKQGVIREDDELYIHLSVHLWLDDWYAYYDGLCIGNDDNTGPRTFKTREEAIAYIEVYHCLKLLRAIRTIPEQFQFEALGMIND